MKIHHLYSGSDGESHFGDIEIEWSQINGSRKYSERLAATGIIFRETGGDYDLDWHPAPRRQYIINLDAAVKLTASDGEARVIAKGDIWHMEDRHGKGHHTEVISDEDFEAVIVQYGDT